MNYLFVARIYKQELILEMKYDFIILDILQNIYTFLILRLRNHAGSEPQ